MWTNCPINSMGDIMICTLGLSVIVSWLAWLFMWYSYNRCYSSSSGFICSLLYFTYLFLAAFRERNPLEHFPETCNLISLKELNICRSWLYYRLMHWRWCLGVTCQQSKRAASLIFFFWSFNCSFFFSTHGVSSCRWFRGFAAPHKKCNHFVAVKM